MKKKKTYKTEPPRNSRVQEPLISYAHEEVKIFGSFEEMEKQDALEMARLTPVQHLQHVTEYILYAYAKELKHKMKDLTIRFKKAKLLKCRQAERPDGIVENKVRKQNPEIRTITTQNGGYCA